jgi:two-component system phosphate regulon sensor histidine kinase PhoR
VKRIFTIIIILISISLIGIIFIQLSWLNNMVLLRQEQIKEKIVRAVNMVGEELTAYKGTYPINNNSNRTGTLFQDDFTLDFLKPTMLGKKFTGQELEKMIRDAFISVGLDDVKFEFMLNAGGLRSMNIIPERQTKNYIIEQEDTVNNLQRGYPIYAPSGSAGENL